MAAHVKGITGDFMFGEDLSWDDAPRSVPRVLFGRFILANGSEHVCSVTNVSIEGAEFRSSTLPPFGDSLVAVLEHVGRIHGRAAHATGNGFLVEWLYNREEKANLQTKLDWLDDFHEGRTGNERQFQRRPLQNSRSTVTLLDGRKLFCEISDLSMSGAGIAVDVRPETGTRIYLGNVLCEVVRHTQEGLGVRFLAGSGSDLMSELYAGAHR